MFDPLVDAYPKAGHAEPESYWTAVSGAPPDDDGTLQGDREVDVAIIGGGYAGLSAAHSLARDHGIRAIVLEARSTAWGCSGRNGSFARISGGRVGWSSFVKLYGEDVARAYFAELSTGFQTVKSLIEDNGIECDRQPDGVYKVASFAGHADPLRSEAQLYNQVLKYPARFVSHDELKGIHNGPEAHGALHLPDGFPVNPLLLARGLHRLARKFGAVIHTNSPVIDWKNGNGRHELVTPQGIVRAKSVIVATNGYTTSKLHRSLAARVLPVRSQIIVTAQLTDEQVAASLPSGKCMFDTRGLLFYYRRLPDNRILFGGRSAISGKDASAPRHRQYLHDAVIRKFPALAGIGVDYWWGGWVAVTSNSLPFCCKVEGLDRVYTAGGYAGSGVSFSIYLGTRLAQMAAGKPYEPAVPFLTSEPERYPFSAFLRIGQWVAYRWLHVKDGREARQSA